MRGHPNWSPKGTEYLVEGRRLVKEGKVSRACERCGELVVITSSRQKFCVPCRVLVRREYCARSKVIYLKKHGLTGAELCQRYYKRLVRLIICRVCGKEFLARREQRLCSPECVSRDISNRNAEGLARGVFKNSGHTDIERAKDFGILCQAVRDVSAALDILEESLHDFF